jgi:hypothetical protein
MFDDGETGRNSINTACEGDQGKQSRKIGWYRAREPTNQRNFFMSFDN